MFKYILYIIYLILSNNITCDYCAVSNQEKNTLEEISSDFISMHEINDESVFEKEDEDSLKHIILSDLNTRNTENSNQIIYMNQKERFVTKSILLSSFIDLPPPVIS